MSIINIAPKKLSRPRVQRANVSLSAPDVNVYFGFFAQGQNVGLKYGPVKPISVNVQQSNTLAAAKLFDFKVVIMVKGVSETIEVIGISLLSGIGKCIQLYGDLSSISTSDLALTTDSVGAPFFGLPFDSAEIFFAESITISAKITEAVGTNQTFDAATYYNSEE